MWNCWFESRPRNHFKKGSAELHKFKMVIRRLGAFFSAFLMVFCLTVSCFASNNASTKKWKIIASAQKLNEMGTMSTYFQLSPYSNGALYRAYFSSRVSPVSVGNFGHFDYWITPYNWPDWWRSAIPLGARAYIQVDSIQVSSAGYDLNGERTILNSPALVKFFCIDKRYLFNLTSSYSSSALALNGQLYAIPYITETTRESNSSSSSSSISWATLSTVSVPVGGSFPIPITGLKQVVLGFNDDSLNENVSNSRPFTVVPLSNNLSSDDLVIGFMADAPYNVNKPCRSWLDCTAVISFWVGADKLPAGLKVGDEFPADTDAFDQLRENLIDQFPEASDHITNDKSTFDSWNDTETVDTDVANTSLDIINGLFQNVGNFAFIVSLLCFGAVVLRVLIRKAVEG